MYAININPVLNGFVVQVGCKTVVFNNLDMMCSEIHRYYNDPDKVANEYIMGSINSDKTTPMPPQMIGAAPGAVESYGPIASAAGLGQADCTQAPAQEVNVIPRRRDF